MTQARTRRLGARLHPLDGNCLTSGMLPPRTLTWLAGGRPSNALTCLEEWNVEECRGRRQGETLRDALPFNDQSHLRPLR